jgi:hypothetical protein
VRDLLAADEARVDSSVGHAALLLASCGFTAESDRLVTRWHRVTERPAAALVTEDVTARAWANLFEARGARPDWAESLPPLDLDAEEAAHEKYLRHRDPAVPAGLLGDTTAARIVSGVADRVDGDQPPDPVRVAASEVDSLARKGNLAQARESLGHWVSVGRSLSPNVAALAGCRSVAPLLVSGSLAEAFGIDEEWVRLCSGDLMAALRVRYPTVAEPLSWPALIAEILRLREIPASSPPPSTVDAVLAAERRLGVRLPDDYREFLLTCDGLPADVVFPRLRSAAELVPADLGVVVISDGGPPVLTLSQAGSRWIAVSYDPVLGSIPHPGFRALLEDHRRLLEESA